MKTTMKSILLLITCILLMPTVVFAGISLDSKNFNLTVTNLNGLTGPYVNVSATLDTNNSATFTFTGYNGTLVNEVGLNLMPDPSTLTSQRSTTITYNLPYYQENKGYGGSMDHLGDFNYIFNNTVNSGSSSAANIVALTLVWNNANFSTLDDVFNSSVLPSAGAHILTQNNVTGYAVGNYATTTPIPAAAWLLGSGLLGLIGIKKRTNS